MSYFIQYSSTEVKILYIICFVMYIFYFVDKWHRTKIVFSPFNFQVIFFTFVLLIISPFQYNYKLANSWTNITKDIFIDRLNEAYLINLFGFLIMGCGLVLVEKRKNIDKKIESLYSYPYYNISEKNINIISVCLFIIFWCYVIINAKGIPLLNGNRGFSQNTNQFVFLLLQGMIYILTWYYVGKFTQKKLEVINILCILLGIGALLITANRTPVLKILYAILIVSSSARGKINYKTVFKQMRYVILIILIGILMIIMRSGSKVLTLGSIWVYDIVYGSTFCDIRDCARILYGYHNKYAHYLYGKTYLASLMSFIPSSLANSQIPILSALAQYRLVYSGGRWSTYTLFGINNHYGLRGGMFSTAYVNFGWIGIILVALILAYWFGNCEILYLQTLEKKQEISMSRMLFSYCYVNIFFELLYAPAGFNQVWGYIIILCLFQILKKKIIINRHIGAKEKVIIGND